MSDAAMQQRMVPTEENALPESERAALVSFCEAHPEIEVAFVCAIERTNMPMLPETGIRLCVKLNRPVDLPTDSRESSMALARALGQVDPALMKKFGFGVMADRAVPAWANNGIQIYPARGAGL